MKRKTALYPGIAAAENEKRRAETSAKYTPPEEPDFIGGKPNYDKFPGKDPVAVLVWLNID